jgi:hypothetical protein
MQDSFPELTVLHLSFQRSSYGPVLSDSFLGGPAPRLQCFSLKAILFPGLPKLLLSATHLVKFCLVEIPRSGYISPEAMVTSLSMLTCLDQLYLDSWIRIPSILSRPQKPTSTSANSLCPPRSHEVNTPELNQFISRTPILGTYDEAHLTFHNQESQVSPSSISPRAICVLPSQQQMSSSIKVIVRDSGSTEHESCSLTSRPRHPPNLSAPRAVAFAQPPPECVDSRLQAGNSLRRNSPSV